MGLRSDIFVLFHCHFGHYMASTNNTRIAQFNAILVSIPAITGYSPMRWWKSLNIMLEKSLRNIKVEQLRIVILFKANCNYNNKWLGWAFMHLAEKAKLLVDKQYGSHCFKDAITQECFNK